MDDTRTKILNEIDATLKEMAECRNDKSYETMAKGVLALSQAAGEMPRVPSFKEWLASMDGNCLLEVMTSAALTYGVMVFERDGVIFRSQAWRQIPGVHRRRK